MPVNGLEKLESLVLKLMWSEFQTVPRLGLNWDAMIGHMWTKYFSRSNQEPLKHVVIQLISMVRQTQNNSQFAPTS